MQEPWSSRARRTVSLEVLEERVVPSADTVLEWNAIALQVQVLDNALGGPAQQAGPTRASRALAIVQAAVFDAVNSIDGSYTPYLVAVNAPAGASIDAAAAQAAHDTLSALYPAFKAGLDAALAADLAKNPGPAEQGGVFVGHTAAATILAARAHDNSDVNVPYMPGTAPGDWQPDPLHPTQQALTPGWGNVTPFVIPSAEQFQAPPPPALDSLAYTAAFLEVKYFGGDGVHTPTLRTPEQTQIGIFWAYDGQPGMGTPVRLYNQIAEVIATQEHNSEVQNARFFALINLAMGDAGIAAWDTKYDDNFWRPITAIRAANTDGNPFTVADPNWTPLGAQADNGNGTNFTPPFPAYTSGHATFGAALFRIMADFYGRDDIHFTIGSDEFNGVTKDQNGHVRPVVTRSFDSFSDAAEENAQSRIYLGIHWQFDKVQGVREGDAIADYVFGHALLPVQRHHHGADAHGDTVIVAEGITATAPGQLLASGGGATTSPLTPELGFLIPSTASTSSVTEGGIFTDHPVGPASALSDAVRPLVLEASGGNASPFRRLVPLASNADQGNTSKITTAWSESD
jgi:hypothetical protein